MIDATFGGVPRSWRRVIDQLRQLHFFRSALPSCAPRPGTRSRGRVQGLHGGRPPGIVHQPHWHILQRLRSGRTLGLMPHLCPASHPQLPEEAPPTRFFQIPVFRRKQENDASNVYLSYSMPHPPTGRGAQGRTISTKNFAMRRPPLLREKGRAATSPKPCGIRLPSVGAGQSSMWRTVQATVDVGFGISRRAARRGFREFASHQLARLM